jgi:DNA-binding NtrC family response regulator
MNQAIHELVCEEDLELVRQRIDEALPWLHPISKKYQADSSKLDDLMREQMQQDRVLRLGQVKLAKTETFNDVELQSHIDRLAARHKLWDDNTSAPPSAIPVGPRLIRFDIDDRLSVDEIQKRYVLHVLRHMGGNIGKTAEVLGLSRRSLRRRLKQWQQLND